MRKERGEARKPVSGHKVMRTRAGLKPAPYALVLLRRRLPARRKYAGRPDGRRASPALYPQVRWTNDSKMSSFKGNDGNLMQHWVLCELLAVARKYTTRLTFIDAHSMAPTAIQRTEKKANRRRNFDSVLKNLSGQGSSYEQAWQSLSPERGTYPNSANFVTHIWSPPSICSLLLCERDEQTVSLLRSWAVKHSELEIEIAAGDWRTRFDRALPKQEGLVFISFDPYMFNRHRRKKKPGNMYPRRP